jgi:hypothetical protein
MKNEDILQTIISLQITVSSIDNLDSDVRVQNVKHLSKRLVDEILRTQKSNLAGLWKIGEDDVIAVWKVYEDAIATFVKCPIDKVPLFSYLAQGILDGDVVFGDQPPAAVG